MRERKSVVSVDMDDTCYEFVKPLLHKYNLWYEDNVQYEDITDWDIHQFLKPECKNVFELCTPGFFESLHISQENKEWLETLNVIADVRFVTAGYSPTIPLRAELLKRELPFFKDYMLVKLAEKDLFRCEYLIDDNEQHCIDTDAITYQIARPWNDNQGFTFPRAASKVVQSILKRGEK